MRCSRLVAFAMIALAGLASVGAAQQIETPVAFDSAGRVMTMTPALIARYQLAAPAWPVTGPFVEARLFSLNTGGHTLTVERQSGAIERYPLSDEELASLRAAVDAAMTLTGGTPVESRPDVISEPARNAFLRNQTLLSLGLYGPLLASLADDGKTGTALYLLGAGGSFFISMAISRETEVTRAQNHLATDGAIRGYGATSGLIYASRASVGRKTYSGIGLAGALGGAILGYQRGAGMTDAEAEATTTISTLAAATGFGLTAAIGGLDDHDARAAVGTAVGAGLVGYFLGPNYPRRASYTVTRGDIQMLSLSSVIGAAIALTPIVDSQIEEELGFGLTTAGLLAGALVGDRALVRAFDYSMSDATLVQFSAVAGGLMGAAVAVLAEPQPEGVMALVTGGAILGAVAGHNFANPPRGRSASALQIDRALGSARLVVDPSALALAAVKTPGRHAVVRLAF